MMSSLFLRGGRFVLSQSRRSTNAAISSLYDLSGIDINTRNGTHKLQTRSFGRKGSKMGHHLQNLDELAHREAKKKRGKNKKGKNSDDENTPKSSSFEMEEIQIVEDENETMFDHGGGEDDDETPSLPDKEEVKVRMMKVVNAMDESFRSIRGAEPSPELFDTVQVKAYGSMTPLNAVAQVIIPSPTMATITCFDPAVAPAVRDAVRDMPGMNFNPQIEDGTVTVKIPKVSAETRQAIVKQLNKVAENTKQRVRRIRRAAQDVVKKGKDGSLGPGISEDDAFRAGKEIDAVTDESIKALSEIVQRKQDDVMRV